MYWPIQSRKTILGSVGLGYLSLLCSSEFKYVHAFAPNSALPTKVGHVDTHTNIYSTTMNGPEIGFEESCVMTKDDVSPIFTLKKGEPKEKMINSFGLYCLLVSLVVNPIWSLAMFITDAVCKNNEELDENRAFYDMTGKIWAKVWLTLTDSYPTISGDLGRLDARKDQGACLFVANHASWLDIPVLCTVLDPVFKFIAKGELRSVPCIGQQLVGGKHILIDREDRRSQLRTFKEGVGWLKNGMPLMAFPEGKRSDDGRLDDFKGGVFSMAVKAGVPIVPISISNTHAVMPSNSLFPVQRGSGKLHLHIHDPISAEGVKEDELAAMVREALLSKMPLDQHPLPKANDDNMDATGEVEKELQSA